MQLATERQVEERYETQDAPFDELLGAGMKRKAAFLLGLSLILASSLVVALVALGFILA